MHIRLRQQLPLAPHAMCTWGGPQSGKSWAWNSEWNTWKQY